MEINDMNNIENVRMMFYMSLSFFGFLRISELLNLKKKKRYNLRLRKKQINIKYTLFKNRSKRSRFYYLFIQ